MVDLLRRAKPPPKGRSLFESQPVESWPQDNEAQEAALRLALLDAVSEPVAVTRQTLLDLEKSHCHRREWVWARLNRSPLAAAVQHLATLAEITQTPLTGAKVA